MNRCPTLLAAARFTMGGTVRTMAGTSRPSLKYTTIRTGICRVGQQKRWMNGGGAEEFDASTFTHEIKIRMPGMGEGHGKVLEWYKQKGDIIRQEDILCDIETKDFSFGMVTDDECDAIMGDILVEAGSDPVEDDAVICTVFHPEEESDEREETDS